MRLADELTLYGCDYPAEQFEDVLQEVFAVMFPAWLFEHLMCEPTHGVAYCQAVRRAIGCPGLPERLIMQRRLNIRKASKERKEVSGAPQTAGARRPTRTSEPR